MKDCGRNMWRIVRIILSVICGLFAFVYFILIFFEDPAIVFVILGLIFAGLSALLVPKKVRIKQVSAWQPDVPQDIARDMRKCYTSTQAENDLRILSDSWQLVQETADIKVFCSRLELAQRTALTLIQAKAVGCRCARRLNIKACESVLKAVPEAKAMFLENSYNAKVEKALSLKTARGQVNRLEAYRNELDAYSYFFMDVEEAYSRTLQNLDALISDLRNE